MASSNDSDRLMAFVLADLSDPKGIRVDGLSSKDEFLARIYIGEDPETGAVYSVMASLSPFLLGGSDRKEFVFGVVEAVPEYDEPIWINDGAETKRFLTGEDRKAVLDCVCAAAVALAEAARPEVISFTTAVANLPPKALTKYGHICKALTQAGYRGGRGNEYHGSHIWMMTRRRSEP